MQIYPILGNVIIPRGQLKPDSIKHKRNNEFPKMQLYPILGKVITPRRYPLKQMEISRLVELQPRRLLKEQNKKSTNFQTGRTGT